MMSDPESHFEAILCRVREQLNQERLQLWLPPFTVEGESKGRYPEVLARNKSMNYSESLRTAYFYITYIL